MKTELPYNECKNCKTLTDCPHPDVINDSLGTPLPPDICPKPLDVMRETIKVQKLIHKLSKEN